MEGRVRGGGDRGSGVVGQEMFRQPKSQTRHKDTRRRVAPRKCHF